MAEINSVTFFKSPFNTLVINKQLQEYTVINIEPIGEHERHKFAGQGALSKKVKYLLIGWGAKISPFATIRGLILVPHPDQQSGFHIGIMTSYIPCYQKEIAYFI